MTDPLWKKSGQEGPDEVVQAFLSGDDVALDRELILFDIQASAAHADGLESIGLLSNEENRKLQDGLCTIRDDLVSGKRSLDERFEDGHSALETWLTEMLGPLGGRIHAGRSRNDQVAVALRLFMMDLLDSLAESCAEIAETLLERAGRETGLAIPGHTHLQKAMVSSAGLWCAGHAEAFIDNAAHAAAIRKLLDACPLGTASGFGINLPLPRQQVSDQLGFSRMLINPQYAQNARGKAEWVSLGALGAATLDLRRLAWDLSLFCSDEFGYLRLPERYCTGSSIMPNKRNPDVLELLRATHAVVAGAQAELSEILALPSGYHRDLQATKAPLMRAFAKTLSALELVPGIVAGFEWNREAVERALTPPLFATDEATRLAAQGMPFREAYRKVGEALAVPESVDPADTLEGRVSPGASARLMLDEMAARLHRIRKPEK